VQDLPIDPEQEAIVQGMRAAAQAGLSPRQVADQVFDAIQNEQFYILTHSEYNAMIQQRMENILQQHNPA
jgi:hypothetical protein